MTASREFIATRAAEEANLGALSQPEYRYWPVAEIHSGRWYLAEDHREGTDNIRCFISPSLRHLTALWGKSIGNGWRCFAYLVDSAYQPAGVLFDEVLDVFDLPISGMLVFRLKGGLLATEVYGRVSQPYIGARGSSPKPFITGNLVFKRTAFGD